MVSKSGYLVAAGGSRMERGVAHLSRIRQRLGFEVCSGSRLFGVSGLGLRVQGSIGSYNVSYRNESI